MADEKGWLPASKADEVEGRVSGDDGFDRLFGQLGAAAPVREQDGSASQVFLQAHTSKAQVGVFAPEATAPWPVPGLELAATASFKTLKLDQGNGTLSDNSALGRVGSSHDPGGEPDPLQAPAEENAPGDFTRIFTRLPPPSSPPPAALAEVVPVQPAAPASTSSPVVEGSLPAAPQEPARRDAKPPESGEFTRFFQALKPAPAQDSAASPGGLTGAGAAARESQPEPAPHMASSPLHQGQSAAEGFAAAASPGSASGSPGAFTAFFQASGPATPRSQQAFAPVAQPEVWPLHAPAQRPAADFAAPLPATPLLATLPEVAGPGVARPGVAEPVLAEPVLAEPGGSESAAGGFTELLRSLESESAQIGPTAAGGFTPLAAQSGPEPVRELFGAPSLASAAPPGGPGEFTQLLASLRAPGAEMPGALSPASPPPVFATGGAALSQPGASEFTRIMQGSAARAAETPVPTFTPAPQSSGAAVGLPIAAPASLPKFALPPAPAPAALAKTSLQKMLPWLLGANALLLLAVVILILLYLRHKH